MFRPESSLSFESPESRAQKLQSLEKSTLEKISQRGNKWLCVAGLSLLSTALAETAFVGKAHADVSVTDEIASLGSGIHSEPFTLGVLNKVFFSSGGDTLRDGTWGLSEIIREVKPFSLPDLGFTTSSIIPGAEIGFGVDPNLQEVLQKTELRTILTLHFE